MRNGESEKRGNGERERENLRAGERGKQPEQPKRGDGESENRRAKECLSTLNS